MCCIPALYSIMILFYIEMCGSTFFAAAAAWLVLAGCGSASCTGWPERRERHSSPRDGAGSGERCTTASNLPAEPVAALRGLKHMLYTTRGGGLGRRAGGGTRSTPTLIQTSLKNLTRDKSADLFDLPSGPVVFSQIKSFGHNDETTQQGAYLSLTQLQYKTVRKRQKKTKQKCKKGLSVFTLNNTPEALHSWVFYKSFGSFFFCVFTFSCKQLCEKCLQWVLKSEMCIRYAARVLWPIFTFSLSVFHVPFCKVENACVWRRRGWWEVGRKLNGADRPESIYLILECSFHVLWRRWRSPAGPFSSGCDWVDQNDDDVLCTGASKIIGV